MADHWSQPFFKEEVSNSSSTEFFSSYQGEESDVFYGLPPHQMPISDISRDISKEIFQPPPAATAGSGEPSNFVKYPSPGVLPNGNYTEMNYLSPVMNSDTNVISIKPEFEESGYDDFARELIREEIIADIQKKIWSDYEVSSYNTVVIQDSFEDDGKYNYDVTQSSEINSSIHESDSLIDYMPDNIVMEPPPTVVKKSKAKKKKKKSKTVKSKPCSVSLHKIRLNNVGDWSQPKADCMKCTEIQIIKSEGVKVKEPIPCQRVTGDEICGCLECSKNPQYKCSDCGKAFWKKYGLKKHLIVHSDERPFKCDLCPKEFRRMDSLHLHRRTHTKERLSCDICGKAFSRDETLRKHSARCATQPKDKMLKKVKCTMCEAEFGHSGDLKKHVRESHAKEGNFVCSVCGKSYSRLYHLRQHEGRHVGVLPKCVICGKCFLKEESLKQHVQLHSMVIEKKCEECGKDLHSLNSIRYHKIMHSGKKQYKCDVCGKEFYMLGHMRFHKKMHGSENKYTCKDCGKEFFWLKSFQAHQETHIKNPFSCRSCSKVFSDDKFLQRHYKRKNH